jgi:diadenosine tetraphosphate (Ap4A) HIT family hydrolase
MNVPASCPFCDRIADGDLLAHSPLAVAFLDAFPLNPGHAVVIPRRHVANLFDLTAEEQRAVWELLPSAKDAVERTHTPAAYNIGVNVGAAAGQTVHHAHVHLIPRYPGDVEDPRGGIRWVIPERAAYWKLSK